MNDRQRLEAIVSVVCKYLPPDGIGLAQAMNEIISLVDPLPPVPTAQPKEPEQEPDDLTIAYMAGFSRGKDSAPQRTWVGLTEEDKQIAFDSTQEGGGFWEFADAIEAKLKEKNT